MSDAAKAFEGLGSGLKMSAVAKADVRKFNKRMTIRSPLHGMMGRVRQYRLAELQRSALAQAAAMKVPANESRSGHVPNDLKAISFRR